MPSSVSSAALNETQHSVGSSTSTVSHLPSIGAPLRPWGEPSRGRHFKGGVDKVNLWSAVALQNHFGRSGGVARRMNNSGSHAQVTATAAAGGRANSTRQARSISTLDDDDGLNTAVLPPPQPEGRLTLAQKMGLVPLPPAEPTDDDWRAVEQRALLRQGEPLASDRVCGICHESFYATASQGQIILSCSHVFHENCFRQMERFTRQQQREDGSAGLHVMACPECRQTHYHKRTFFAGKALAQRAAVVRIQAAFRGYLARRAYTQLRLRTNSEFRNQYVMQRLAKLSAAWEAYLEQCERDRESIMTRIETQKEEAQAAYLTESDWHAIIRARVKQDAEELRRARVATDERHRYDARTLHLHTCPICLEAVERGWRPSDCLAALPAVTRRPLSASDEEDAETGSDVSSEEAVVPEHEHIPGTGEDYVASLRREYEQRKRDEEKAKRQEARRKERARQKKLEVGYSKGQTYKLERAALTDAERAERFRSLRRYKPIKKDDVNDDGNRATDSAGRKGQTKGVDKTPPAPLPPPPPPPDSLNGTLNPQLRSSLVLETNLINHDKEQPVPRYGTILSCGHVFHEACLGTFERSEQWRHYKGQTGVIAHRCPLCRSGYKKHHF